MSGRITSADVRESGASPFAVEILVSGHRLTGDEPADSGGGNLGPSPYDLLTAALAECTAMTVRWYAKREGWPLERVDVRVDHEKGATGAASPRQDVFTKCITLVGPALDEEQREKLLEVAAKCPVQRSLEGTPLIRTRCAD
jgi:putative redox protein